MALQGNTTLHGNSSFVSLHCHPHFETGLTAQGFGEFLGFENLGFFVFDSFVLGFKLCFVVGKVALVVGIVPLDFVGIVDVEVVVRVHIIDEAGNIV